MVRCNAALVIAALVCSIALSGFRAGAAEPPSIDEEISIPGWWVAGPFLNGVREAGVDPLAFAEGAPDFASLLLRPSFPSTLVPGGEARWRYYKSGAAGKLAVDYPEVSEAAMKLVTDEWGGSGANTVGYAFATLHIDGGPKRALLDLRGAGSISINGVPWPGDAYGNGAGTQPVLLPDGDSELKVAVGASQSFSLKFLPARSDIVLFTQSATLPDIVRGEAPPTLIGLPVANTTTQWLTVTTAEINSQHLLGAVKPINLRIPPLCVANLALELEPEVDRIPKDLAGDTLPALITVSHSNGYIEMALDIGINDFAQPHKVTFRSAMDNSVQYYGLLPPSNFDPARKYGLILSLHGAGVEAIGQVGSYRPKDWAYVAAPTNRRPYGFDWQDWGQRDMLEVLAEVKRTCKIDDDRVHLTGHSMGGHGTWLNALTFPGLWASAAPSAGWTRFDLYAPMFLRRNLLYGDPKANYIWQLAMRQDDTLALCENAKNLPIFAMEGGADDNVPPQQPRLLVERLKQLGYDITYKEVSGMGHWWDDPATPGIDCIDSAELNAFWESHVRNPWPKEVVIRSTGRALVPGACWIDAVPIHLHQDLVLRAKVMNDIVTVSTVNADFLGLNLSQQLVTPSRAKLVVDGDDIQLKVDAEGVLDQIYLFKTAGHWHVEQVGYYRSDSGDIYPTRASGWKGVLMQPCRVVIPAAGDQEENQWCLQLARLYAYNWWYRGNGALTILTDNEALADQDWRGNFICIGTAWSNQVRNAISADSPLWYGFGGLSIAGRMLPEKDVSYKFIAPYSMGSNTGLCLVEGGTSLKALKRLAAVQGIYSGAGFPDWMVWDDEAKLKGMGGVLGMGLFGMDWQVDPELSYFNEDLISQR